MTEAPYRVTIPQETVNDESVRIVGWKVLSGSVVEKDQLICEIETSKAVIEMHAPVAGVLQYQAAVGDEVAVGSALCTIGTEGSSAVSRRSTPDHFDTLAAPQQSVAAVSTAVLEPESLEAPSARQTADLPPSRMTPLARKVAAEYKIDISAFPPGSLVRKNDVLRRAGLQVEEPIAPRARQAVGERVSQTQVPRPTAAVGVPVEWKNLARKKVIEGKILEAGQSTTVQSAVTRRVKAPLLRARVRELHQSEVAFDALILFEASRILLQFPQFNALHDAGRIGEYRQININWAIDSGSNLVAPVVKLCDQKSFGEIVAEMEQQLEMYLDGGLGLEDLTGGTFTVSDLSADGICFFNPLISQGQAAILGVSSDMGAAGEEDLYLTLSFDHQLAEGRTAARFLKELATRLEAHSTVEALKVSTLSASATKTGEGAYCEICQRSYAQLQRSRAVLLRSEIPAGLVCSLCVGGF
jgi:pyruvate/2-oxoglutarate dehydrogenase complex dihydrolipoamide acyltransferase (E2) component